MDYDGFFYIENEVRINYRVDSELHGAVYRHGELIKASRMVYFFDVSGENLGFKPYYAEIEKLTTVLPHEMCKLFLQKET